MTKKYKVVNKLRFTIFVVIMILLITSFANFALGLNTANSLTRLTYMDYEITAGDTLWTIAETYMTDVSDIREAVYELCQLNDIRAGELYVRMMIEIPIQFV